MSKIKIIKADGREDFFSGVKLRSSLKRSGASEAEAKEVEIKIKNVLYPGITTGEIYKKAFKFLGEKDRPAAERYNLRRAIMEIGPTGYPFEQLVGRILELRGYKVTYPEKTEGRCVTHEIDVLATKGEEMIMVEAKFHNQPGFRTNIKTALYVQARYQDLLAADNLFTECWLVTNAKFTQDAKDYGRCQGINLIGWNYPKDEGVEKMIEESGLMPVTALIGLSKNEKKILLDNNFVVCKDLIDREGEIYGLGLDKNKIGRWMEEARMHTVVKSYK